MTIIIIIIIIATIIPHGAPLIIRAIVGLRERRPETLLDQMEKLRVPESHPSQ
jgi:hypothetical protein